MIADTGRSPYPFPRSISCAELAALFASPRAPFLFDLRSDEAFAGSGRMLPGALRVSVARMIELARSAQRPVVAYCVHGLEKSQQPVASLLASGAETRYLAGGSEAWQAQGWPTLRQRPDYGVPSGQGSLWVTRERPKIDRIACPWLIRRFIDPLARIRYVPSAEVLAVAERERAVAFDTPGAPIGHDGPRCSFDALLQAFDLHDACLDELAAVVRGADTGRMELAPQCAGLLAISLGLGANFADDHELLERGMVVYDALYAWLRGQAANADRGGRAGD